MDKVEFSKAIVYLAAACKQSIPPASMEVYFDLLGDLPYDTFLAAAKRVALEHPWNTFPSVAELRAAATATMRGAVQELSASESWAMAWRAVGSTDPEVDGSWARASKDLPSLVREAVTTFGLNAMCYGTEPVGVVRGQFMKVYEQLAAREQRLALYPPKLKTVIEGIGQQLPARVQSAIAAIGQPKE